MKTIKYISVLAGMIFLITSCGEDFVDLTNPNQITTGSFWQTENDAVLGTNAMYQALIFDGTYMRFGPWIMDVRADDVLSTTPGYFPEDVANYIVDADNIAYRMPWEHNYIGVWRANQVLDNIEDITMDEDIKARCKGEAYFIRGLCYFNLLNLFRNVVLFDHNFQSIDDYYIPQSPPEQVWQFTIGDFRKAEQNLWLRDKTDEGRATKGAAAAFLAKSYMINHKFDSAATVLLDIISTAEGGNQKYGLYSLVDDYRDNFTEENENNSESLFEIQYAEIEGLSVQGFTGDPQSNWLKTDAHHKGIAAQPWGWGDLAPNPWIYEQFQLEKTVDGKLDPRMEASLIFYHEDSAEYTVYGYLQDSLYAELQSPGTDTANWLKVLDLMTFATPDVVSDTFKVFIRKWLTEDPVVEDAWRSCINRRIMRYDDVLLMYAECQNEMNNQAECAKYIQIVRDRANLPDREAEFAGYTQDQMRDQIDHERLLEFCFEAWRYVDELRWGWFDSDNPETFRIDELRAIDPEYLNWSPGREYMAIPPMEIDRTNGIVKQNPGWN
jgi:hypothetical protein